MSEHTKKVDVLDWLDGKVRVAAAMKAIHADRESGRGHRERELREAEAVRTAVAELIAAAEMVKGEHNAPSDCYAAGPLTGDPHIDLVACLHCRLIAALARIGSAS